MPQPQQQPGHATPVLEAVDLHVEIPLPIGHLQAVRGVSLSVGAGESVGLVGESGCGKSITLRALLGLLPVPARVTGGALLLDGVDVLGMPRAQATARAHRRHEHGLPGLPDRPQPGDARGGPDRRGAPTAAGDVQDRRHTRGPST